MKASAADLRQESLPLGAWLSRTPSRGIRHGRGWDRPGGFEVGQGFCLGSASWTTGPSHLGCVWGAGGLPWLLPRCLSPNSWSCLGQVAGGLPGPPLGPHPELTDLGGGSEQQLLPPLSQRDTDYPGGSEQPARKGLYLCASCLSGIQNSVGNRGIRIII